jgi:hypothetical protein
VKTNEVTAMKTITLVLLLLLVSPAQAGNDWSIDWYSIDAGGTLLATGGDWELAGTIGQPDASKANELTGGSWSLTGGFWALIAEFLDRIFSDRFADN